MKTYLVGYDLNAPGKNYDPLLKALREDFEGYYWHHLDSTWIIKTDLSATEIRDKLKPPLIDGNDELLVVRLQGNWATWGISEKGSQWLHSNMSYD
ncbi:MAG: SinR family protein [Pyrinomonadaceae bacterium]